MLCKERSTATVSYGLCHLLNFCSDFSTRIGSNRTFNRTRLPFCPQGLPTRKILLETFPYAFRTKHLLLAANIHEPCARLSSAYIEHMIEWNCELISTMKRVASEPFTVIRRIPALASYVRHTLTVRFMDEMHRISAGFLPCIWGHSPPCLPTDALANLAV